MLILSAISKVLKTTLSLRPMWSDARQESASNLYNYDSRAFIVTTEKA